ncbi:hypothetical protein, variant [Sphaeroforma arctica JP610]|uniref:Uncharacterized protein n=1 Tax=Sphaeroforma arctica JP610 TaxID=667725 RepID=A0A0L0GE90_9EUKA|nr:hypothetical protein, variant [Sphaeroforma arctica JP610]KNC87342.1 hypothetical protein, variant [Sphaeroforma arctica JP610]|eukprot:XP_014161245.1 hypothetical protein, variant [Sphaeroforma arctica JP610]
MQRKAYELEDRMRTYLGELLARLSHSNKEITISQLLTTLEDVPDSSALRTCLSAIQPRMKLIDQRKGADRTVKDEPEIRRRTSGRVSKRISGLQPQNAPRSNTRRIGSHRVSGIVPSSAKYATDSTTRRRPSIAIHTSSHDEVDPSGTGRKRVRNKKRETIHVSMELEDGVGASRTGE